MAARYPGPACNARSTTASSCGVLEPRRTVISFGKGGGIATNRTDEQELSVPCLGILALAHLATRDSSISKDPDREAITGRTMNHTQRSLRVRNRPHALLRAAAGS